MNTPAVAIHAEAGDPLSHVDPSKPITNLRHGVLLCDQISRSDMVPRGMQGKPASIFIVIMAGQEIGLSWPVSLRQIFSPGPGQVGMRGELLLAKLHEAGHEYDWEEQPGVSCTFILERYANDATRKTRKYEATFTIDDALHAGLVKRNNDTGQLVALSRDGKPMPWMAYQPDMLFWRAVSRCVKRGAPEVLMGFEIAGAVDGREPEPEVELKPASTEPLAKEELNQAAAEAIREAGRATEEQLRILDERMRREDENGTIQAAGINPLTMRPYDEEADELAERDAAVEQVQQAVEADLAEPVTEDPPGEPGEATGEEPAGRIRPGTGGIRTGLEEDEPPADKAKGQVLAERFEALGWHPRVHRADLVRACSVYLRRPVSGSRDMSTAEVMALTGELSRIQRDNPEETHIIVLADKVEEWRESWEREDPEGYGRYTS